MAVCAKIEDLAFDKYGENFVKDGDFLQRSVFFILPHSDIFPPPLTIELVDPVHLSSHDVLIFFKRTFIIPELCISFPQTFPPN